MKHLPVMRAGWVWILGAPLLYVAPAVGAQQAATVAGRVTDAQGRPLGRAVVLIEPAGPGAQTDADGRYSLERVPPGPQVLRVRLIGYAERRVSITVPASGFLTRDIVLVANPLMLEGIVVTADPVSRARGELGTASVIDLEAIKHQTATSLQGVLELAPGVPAQPPGLDDLQQIALRVAPTSNSGSSFGSLPGATNAGDLASLGTLIVLDGVPISNNANLQSLGPRGELSFTTSASGGVDLRQIPAATLERVEVIRGIPSARWGDLTQGAIVVETRAGAVAAEFAGKLDARTGEASLVGGRALGAAQTGTVTFDFASTRTAPGRADDRAYRVAAQLQHRADWGDRADPTDPRLRLDSRLEFFQLFDDRPENPNTGRTATSISRDRGFRVIERLQARLGGVRLQATGAFTLAQQRSAATAQLTRTALPFTNRLTEGLQEGFFVIGPFEGAVNVDGNPTLAYGRVELTGAGQRFGLGHDWVGGLEMRREWNHGPGRQFDVQFPPQVRFNGVNGYDRPLSFDQFPPLAATALYLDDRLRARLGSATAQLQAGVRLGVLHDGDFTGGVREALIEPRANLEIAPAPWLRLRAGWGRTTKAPTLALLAPPPQYYDLVNVNQFTNDPVERYAVLTTVIRDPTNPDLGFARTTKAEAGIEIARGASALSLVAFRDQITGGFGYRGEPVFLLRDQFALTDTVIGNGIKPEIIEPAIGADTVPVLILRPDNLLTQTNRGFELTAFLPELPAIATRLSVAGSWVETEQETAGLYFGSAQDFSDFQLRQTDLRTPYWGVATETGKRVLLTYRLVHQQAPAGLVLTAMVQHNVTDQVQDLAGTDTLAFLGYLTRGAQLVPVPLEERGQDQYRDLRVPRRGVLTAASTSPADWLLSVQVSKTLPLEGRLNFWAFNLLDRPGVPFTEISIRPRPYLPVRVGLEVTLPARAFWAWARD